jgi:hypothetical protein
LRLVWVANAFFGACFNRSVTRKIGKWAKVKAKIRASTFQSVDQLANDRAVGILALPVLFLIGTAHGELSENFISLYTQTSNRLALTAEEAETIEELSDGENLETKLHERLRCIQSSKAKLPLLNIGITAAAAATLQFNARQHACLLRVSDVLCVDYSQRDLEEKINYLRN